VVPALARVGSTETTISATSPLHPSAASSSTIPSSTALEQPQVPLAKEDSGASEFFGADASDVDVASVFAPVEAAPLGQVGQDAWQTTQAATAVHTAAESSAANVFGSSHGTDAFEADDGTAGSGDVASAEGWF
jgi:hypothetical protein